MAAAAKVGSGTSGMCDIGNKCCPHDRGGECTDGSPNVYIEGAGALRTGDQGECNCPHGGTFELIGGSSTVFINGSAAIRQGEGTQCSRCGRHGEVVDGSRSVYIGG